MPKKTDKQGSKEKKYAYHNEHFKYKLVPFSTVNPDDLEMLEWLSEQKGMAAYIRGLIKADMDRQKAEKAGGREEGTAEKEEEPGL